MLRVLPTLIELGLLLYCLIDCIQAPEGTVRNLPKWAWIILIILVPLIGPLAYLFAGRPQRDGSGNRRAPWPLSTPPGGSRPGSGAGFGSGSGPRFGGGSGSRTSAPRGPDDDPDFLRGLNRPGHPEPDEDEEPPAAGPPAPPAAS